MILFTSFGHESCSRVLSLLFLLKMFNQSGEHTRNELQ